MGRARTHWIARVETADGVGPVNVDGEATQLRELLNSAWDRDFHPNIFEAFHLCWYAAQGLQAADYRCALVAGFHGPDPISIAGSLGWWFCALTTPNGESTDEAVHAALIEAGMTVALYAVDVTADEQHIVLDHHKAHQLFYQPSRAKLVERVAIPLKYDDDWPRTVATALVEAHAGRAVA